MTTGKISACSRPALVATAVRSALALPNRAVSSGSRTNARTTRIPPICSRSTRLTSSIIDCMRRNRGTIRTTITPIAPASTGTDTATSHDSPGSSRSAMTIPPMHMIGAATSIVQEVSTSICTCWTSFVHRVISDGAPNRATSCVENSPTRWKTAARTSRPEAGRGARAVVHGRDRAGHLHEADQQHQPAEPQDQAGVAGGDAPVDDLGVQARQVQRGDGADQLQHDDRRQRRSVGPQVGAQQSGEHDVLHGRGLSG